MPDDYERELTASRDEIGAVLDGLADGIRAGSVQLGEGDDGVTVPLPESAELEIELETADDEVSLEVELEWPAGEAEESDQEADASAESDTETDHDDGPAEHAPVTEATGSDDTDGIADDLVAPVGAAAPIQSLARFEVFRDRADEWRWRLQHRNGNIIATSGEGYTRKHNALKGLRSVMGNAPDAELVDED